MRPSSAPSLILSEHIKYEDHSLFRSMGLGSVRVGGTDLALATLVGLLLLVGIVWFLIFRDRSYARKVRNRKKKKVVMRFDDDDEENNDSDEDETEEGVFTEAWRATLGKLFNANPGYDEFDTLSTHSASSASSRTALRPVNSSGSIDSSSSAGGGGLEDSSRGGRTMKKGVAKAAESVVNVLKKLKVGPAARNEPSTSPFADDDEDPPPSRDRRNSPLSAAPGPDRSRGQVDNRTAGAGGLGNTSRAAGSATIGAEIQMYERVGARGSGGGGRSNAVEASPRGRGGGNDWANKSTVPL